MNQKEISTKTVNPFDFEEQIEPRQSRWTEEQVFQSKWDKEADYNESEKCREKSPSESLI